MTSAITRFLDYWGRFVPTAAPYVHPMDAEYVGRGSELELDLLPIPIIGDVRRADVLISMLNPGLDDGDYDWERRHDFRQRLLSNLRQSFDGVDHPFFYLDPLFALHAGDLLLSVRVQDVPHAHAGAQAPPGGQRLGRGPSGNGRF